MAWSLALSAWVSILPYFFWSHRQLALVISGMGIGAVGTLALWARRQPRLERRDVIAGLTVQGWQDDRVASLVFQTGGAAVTIDQIAEREMAQRLAASLRSRIPNQ